MSTLTPTGHGRRSPLPVIVAVVVALAIGIGGGWWFAGRDKGGSPVAGPSSSSSCSSTTHATKSASKSTKPAALPNPRTIRVNVYNATKHRGLARSTSVELAARGFTIGTVANDPLNKLIVGTAEIRYGSKGAAQARVVAAQVASPVMVLDKRTSVTVDFVIGEAYTTLNTPAQAAVQLTASPSPTATPHC
jgi:LytR cell envelope-related transcriptional attenuator